MNQLDYTTMIAMQHHEQLLKEAENYRLREAAFRKYPKSNRITQFLALVREKLVAMVGLLMTSDGCQPEPITTLNPQTNPEGCK